MNIQNIDNEKEWAFEAFLKRRLVNKGRKPIDNSKLRARLPMHFVCRPCNGDIEVDEGYMLPRPEFCPECTTLQKKGWLQEFIGRVAKMKK